MSIDGFIAGPNGEMDWMTFNWGDDLYKYVQSLTEDVDCILLGRKLAEGFIPHWAAVAADAENPENETGKMFSHMPKVVFSHTLSESTWPDTYLVKGELVEEVNKLKAQQGKDMIAYGGAEFASSLIKHKLIDEYFLFVNPVVLGKGKPIFSTLEDKLPLQLINTQAFDCGIMLQHFKQN